MLKTAIPANTKKTSTRRNLSVCDLAEKVAESIRIGRWDTGNYSIGAHAQAVARVSTSLMDRLTALVATKPYGGYGTVLGWESKRGRTKTDVVELLRDVASCVE